MTSIAPVSTTLRRLPTLRAAVGGALVLAAAVGVLAAHSAATRPPSTRYAVVRHQIAAGHVLAAADLGTVAVALPRGSQVVPSTKVDQVVGRTAATDLHRLDLLRPADLVPRDEDGAGILVPLDVDAARAPGPALRTGAVVTVLATDPDSSGTLTVAAAATVVAVDVADESVGTPSTRHVRLRVATPAAAAALVDAAVRTTLTLTVPTATTTGGPR